MITEPCKDKCSLYVPHVKALPLANFSIVLIVKISKNVEVRAELIPGTRCPKSKVAS